MCHKWGSYVDLQIHSESYGHASIQIPVQIRQSSVSYPLLGGNVIAELIKENNEQVDITAILKKAMSVMKVQWKL